MKNQSMNHINKPKHKEKVSHEDCWKLVEKQEVSV